MDVVTYSWKVAAAWLSVVVGVSTNSEDIIALSRRGKTKWQRYGAPAILVLRGALESYYQIEHVLEGDDVSMSSYQESLLMECNMVSVAAAIVASVTITTYQFPSIDAMHWTVSAAFTFSLVASLFCVYGACTLQRRISNLPSGRQFRAWLSAPPPYVSNPELVKAGNISTSSEEYLKANVATVLTLTAPKTLLDHAIRFFLAGLVGYLVCQHSISLRSNSVADEAGTGVMLSPSGDSPLGSRNTIIVCAFSLCIGISLLISPSSYKNFRLTISSPIETRRHGHGNAGMAEGPQYEGLAHYMPTSSAVMQITPEKRQEITSRDNVKSSHQQSQSQGLIEAMRQAAVAHERSAQASRQYAEAEARVAELYRALSRQ